MLRSFVVAALVAACNGSSVGAPACTQVGCTSGWEATLALAPGLDAAGEHEVEVDADGTAGRCRARFTLPSSSEMFSCEGVSLAIAPAPGGGHEARLSADGAPARIHVVYRLRGITIADTVLTPVYVDHRPNGPRCDPVCRRPSAPLRLTPSPSASCAPARRESLTWPAAPADSVRAVLTSARVAAMAAACADGLELELAPSALALAATDCIAARSSGDVASEACDGVACCGFSIRTLRGPAGSDSAGDSIAIQGPSQMEDYTLYVSWRAPDGRIAELCAWHPYSSDSCNGGPEEGDDFPCELPPSQWRSLAPDVRRLLCAMT